MSLARYYILLTAVRTITRMTIMRRISMTFAASRENCPSLSVRCLLMIGTGLSGCNLSYGISLFNSKFLTYATRAVLG